jgi:hypothetical protein
MPNREKSSPAGAMIGVGEQPGSSQAAEATAAFAAGQDRLLLEEDLSVFALQMN